jgi:hypothetical protein
MKSKFYKTIDDIVYSESKKEIYLITEDLDFKNLHESCIGVIVPYIIAEESLQESGILQISFSTQENANIHTFSMQKNIPQRSFEKGQTLLLFVDPLTALFEPFIDTLNSVLKDNMVYGSGVGSRTFEPMPIVFSNGEIYAEYALVVAFNSYIRVGIKHGWEPMYGPLVVTKTEGTNLLELNNDSAFSVYAEVIKASAGRVITEENFFDIAKGFPLGVLSYANDEFIIRDPLGISKEEGLALLNSIPENETVYIMRGDTDELIASAAENAKSVASSSHNGTHLLFDCISRVLYMEKDAFNQEVKAIEAGAKDKHLNGICSTGEITNVGFSKLMIFNKTNLLGAFYGTN